MRGSITKAWTDREITLFLFLALWLTYGFIGPGWSTLDSNAITRMGLIHSILNQHSLAIADFAPFTIDKAVDGGVYFADKAPGLSFSALPAVAVLNWGAKALHFPAQPIVHGELSRFFRLSAMVAVFFTSALFTAASAAVLYRLQRHWRASRSAAIFAAACLGLATPAAGWATAFFGHAMSGACLLLAFAGITFVTDGCIPGQRELRVALLAGAILAWAVVVEFTAAPAALAIALFGLCRLGAFSRGRAARIAAAAILGGGIAAVPLLVYDTLAFGSPLRLGYASVVGWGGMARGVLGVSVPDPRILYEIIAGPYRGVLWVAPVLLLAPLSYWTAFRWLPRSVVLVSLAVPACYLAINAGYAYWDGGDSTGPRHLTPAVFFVCLTFAPLWMRAGRGLRIVALSTGVVSALVAMACAAVDMTSPQEFANPLLQHILPDLARGQVHDALVNLGVTGLRSLLPIPLIWLIAAAGSKALPRLLPPLGGPRPVLRKVDGAG